METCCSPQDRDLGLAAALHSGALRYSLEYKDRATAEVMYKLALRVLSRLESGPSRDEAVIRLKGDLAEFCAGDPGRLNEAEQLTLETLGLISTCLGRGHFLSAVSLNNLADIYTQQGRYAEAEPLYQRAVKMLDLDPCEQPRILIAVLGQYATMLRKLGRAAEAEELSAHAGEVSGRMRWAMQR